MRDDIVRTIYSLSSMLYEVQEDLVQSYEANDALHKEIDNLRDKLNAPPEHTYEKGRLESDLQQAHRDLASKEEFFRGVTRNPEGFLAAMNFLREEDSTKDKIAAIKRVREFTQMGLRECKDMVEDYIAGTKFVYPK